LQGIEDKAHGCVPCYREREERDTEKKSKEGFAAEN